MNDTYFPIIRISCDVLVVGGGLAAFRAAWAARATGARVRIVAKRRPMTGGATAVGRSEIMGVAAALGHSNPLDSPEIHYMDTVNTGGAFLRRDLVRVLVEGIPKEICQLMKWRVPFEKKGEKLSQMHSDYATYPRNCKADGRTGWEILSVLNQRVRDAGIEIDEEVMIVKLFSSLKQSLGAFGLGRKTNTLYVYESKCVIAACGGAGHLFSKNAVSPEMSGDGYVFALQAGAPLVNMEFLQFGPGVLTCQPLALSGPVYRMAPIFRNDLGEDILKKHVPARVSIVEVLGRKVFPFNGQDESRYLDMAISLENLDGRAVTLQIDREGELLKRIPHTCRRILDAGLSLTDPWPVGIILQCFNGGIYMEDTHCHTRVPGLLVAGEAAGGLRAPTRPGGNALAEALVFGKIAGEEAGRMQREMEQARVEEETLQNLLADLKKIETFRGGRSHFKIRGELQCLCERYLSVVRSAEGLRKANARIGKLQVELEMEARADGFLADYFTTRHLAIVAEVITAAALLREESRGSHFREDFTESREEWNLPIWVTQEGKSLRVEAKAI